MNKPFGARAEIINFPFGDLYEVLYNQNGIEIEVQNGVLSVGVDEKSKLPEGKELALLYLTAWSVRQNIKVQAKFNQHWEPNAHGGKHHSVDVHASSKSTSRVQLQVIRPQGVQSEAAPTEMQDTYDSASFTPDDTIAQKALRHPILKSALLYYSEEVIDHDRPLYGVYKALEAITAHLGSKGRKNLAALVGQPSSYVDDVMQTAQLTRHHTTHATARLTEDECRHRAQVLIDAFAHSLP